MQSLATPARSQSTASVRFPTAVVRVSWDQATNSATIATIDSSTIDGTDVIAGSSGAALPYDSYLVTDESAYVVGFDFERAILEPLGGVASAQCDIFLDNTGNRYTPGYNSTINTGFEANRPLLVDAGFLVGTKRTVPVFKGRTFEQIRTSFAEKKATVRAADLLSILDQKPLAAGVYENQRSDQIIESILNDAGLGTSQYELDTGLNTITFAYFPTDMSALKRIKKVCEAEEAIFYQNERGKMLFKVRTHYSQFPYNTSQITLNKNDYMTYEYTRNTDIINRVIVKAAPREVDTSTTALWDQPEEIEVAAGATKEIWAHPTDPDSSIPLLIKEITALASTTDYTAFTAAGGGGSDITADQVVTGTNFVDAVKIVLKNNNAAKAFYNLLQFRGKAARVKEAFNIIDEDATSIRKYGVMEFVLENDFIQSVDWAETIASSIKNKYKDPTKRIDITIPAIPQLELKDRVTLTDPVDASTADYRVMAVAGKFLPGTFTQVVKLREIDASEVAV